MSGGPGAARPGRQVQRRRRPGRARHARRPDEGQRDRPGHEDQDGYSGNWSVTAFAICADDGGERRTTFNEPLNSINPKFATTADGGPCTNERRLTGAGGEIPIGATGQVVLDTIIPSADLETVSVRAQEDQDGFAGNWSLRPFALCADPLPGQSW